MRPYTRTATRASTKRLATTTDLGDPRTDDEARHPEQSTIGHHQDQFAERKSCSFGKGIRGVQSSASIKLRRESSHLLLPREYGRSGKGRSRCDAVGTQGGRGTRSVVWGQWVPSPYPLFIAITNTSNDGTRSCFLSPPMESFRAAAYDVELHN